MLTPQTSASPPLKTSPKSVIGASATDRVAAVPDESLWTSARIILDDGSEWVGLSPSRPGAYPLSEFVFNTATAGYEEVMTDPSYGGQVVVFTTPHLGTTGWTEIECESGTVAVAGVVCRQLVTHDDNHLSRKRLIDVLVGNGIPVVSGVDTRGLTLRLRERGTMQGCIVVGCPAVADAHHSLSLSDLNAPLHLKPSASRPGFVGAGCSPSACATSRLRVAVIDFGVKSSILTSLEARGVEVVTFPWDTVTRDDVANAGVEGVLFSNGAGDPRCLVDQPERLELYRQLAGSYISRGICFGHQALALAYGARIDKLPFGHHAINHPVACIDAAGDVTAVAITSQNHNYAVSREGLPAELVTSHVHLNDGTVAGLRHVAGVFESVQFHPEAGPGPRDASTFFDEFIAAMKAREAC